MLYEYRFLLSLVLTILIETSVLFLIVKYYFKNEYISDSLLLFAGIFSSFSTLPYLWFLLPQFIDSYSILVVFGEISVFLVEAVIYYFLLKIGIQRSLTISFACNIASFLTGLMIFALI
jgi:hypothetical protein